MIKKGKPKLQLIVFPASRIICINLLLPYFHMVNITFVVKLQK